jgi:branched-chain amino acid transport system ATP-binding protein
MSLLEINGLRKRFGGIAAVNDVTVSVGSGEIVGLIGPNGAGKSTLFSLICGAYRPDKGEVIFEGRSLVGADPSEACRRGVVRTFQQARVFTGISVFENVMVGAYAHYGRTRLARRHAEAVLETTGLSERKLVPARSLTIADRMRLQLARTLSTQPRLLLLDELMAGLVPREIQEMIALIRHIRDTGITIVVIEHIMQAIMDLSDRIVVLDHGVKIGEGTPEVVANDRRVIEAYLGEGFSLA